MFIAGSPFIGSCPPIRIAAGNSAAFFLLPPMRSRSSADVPVKRMFQEQEVGAYLRRCAARVRSGRDEEGNWRWDLAALLRASVAPMPANNDCLRRVKLVARRAWHLSPQHLDMIVTDLRLPRPSRRGYCPRHEHPCPWSNCWLSPTRRAAAARTWCRVQVCWQAWCVANSFDYFRVSRRHAALLVVALVLL
jgi:hypothetical protein